MNQRMRLIENATRRMQRLGFMKYLVMRASLSATSSLQALGNDLLQTVSKKVLLPATPELAEYVRLQKGKETKAIINGIEAAMKQSPPDNRISLELQDAYLAFEDLPSCSGKLVSNDWKNYPRLAIALGLLRKENLSTLVRSQVLLQLVSTDELNAFKEYSPNTNPLELTLQQRLFFLFAFIEHDRHILLPLHRVLLQHEGEFTDWQAGDLLPEIMRDLCRKMRPMVRSGAENVYLEKLLHTAEAIEQWRGKPYNGKGVRDEAATLRLEPFVDLGVLAKKNRFSYRYEFTPAGRHLMTELTKGDSEDGYLGSWFFAKTVEAFNLGLPELSDDDEILHFVYQSYSKLASPLGYAPIREVLLLAIISAIGAGKGYFQISTGLEMLHRLQRRLPNVVRFNVDRMGNLNFVKFTKSPLAANPG